MSGVLDSNESGVAVAELPMHRVAALLAAIDRTRVPDLPRPADPPATPPGGPACARSHPGSGLGTRQRPAEFAARLGDPRKVGVRGFFLFGLAYGAASLGCTLPAFLAVVGSGIAAGGVVPGAVRFLGYGLGMASVLVALTVALAFFKEGLVKWRRGTLPYVQTASALLLMLAGAYVVFYWWTAQNVGSPPG